MKTGLATFLAMVVGWALPLGGIVAWQLADRGRTEDLAFMAIWTGVFALVGWGTAVLPLMVRWGDRALFRDLRYSWAGWALMGVGVYSVLVLLLLWSPVMLFIAWYPAAMGAIAGPVYALLRDRPIPAPRA
jgi:hypothetical protein